MISEGLTVGGPGVLFAALVPEIAGLPSNLLGVEVRGWGKLIGGV